MITSIQLNQPLIDKCQAFALERIGLSEDLYRKRGEARKSKMVEDICVGTMAEWACYSYLKDKAASCVEITEPDMTIYEKRKKSFSPDLQYTAVTEVFNIHVKSQTHESANKYGASWLFQKEDKLFKSAGENDYIAFCLVEGSKVDIMAIVKVLELVERDLLAEPKVFQYKHSKKAIYLDQVLACNIDLQCF